jgi:gliding motility-associated-like protein
MAKSFPLHLTGAMKHFYIKILQILFWVLGCMVMSHQGMAQYTSSVVETGKYYTAIAKDNAGNIYVVAYNSTTTKYQLLKYTNGTGTPTAIYQGLSFSVSEYPWSVAVNSAGDVFVMDPDLGSNWRIIKLAAGTYTPTTIQTGRYFTAITVDASDNLLAMEYDAGTTNYRVVKYAAANLTGAGTTIYNGLPLAVGSGTYPWGIVTDQLNNIYIIDFPNNSFNGRLIKLTAPGYAATTLGSGKGYTSLAIDEQDNLYTTESVNASTSHLMKYAAPVTTGAAGTEIFTGLTIGSLFYPWGIAVTSQGNIFVNDGAAPGNGRLLKLSVPGITVSSVTRTGSNPTNANSVQFTVTFSGTGNNVTTSAFSLNTSGSVTGSSVTSVSGSGSTYTVTVNTGTGDGSLRLNVTGTGMVNNVTNAPYTSGEVYTIDKTAPTGTLTINGGATTTNTLGVTLNITSSGATQMRFSTDNTNWTPNEAVAASKSFTLPAGEGLKTVYMQLSDAAGNTQTYQAQITVDTTPPNGTIATFPPAITNSPTATFTFTSTEPSTYMVSLDGTAAVPATSPYTLTGLAPGAHSLSLTATDLAGNADLVPDIYNWTIDITPPAVTSVNVPADGYYHAGQTLDFTVNFSEAVNVNTTTGTPSFAVTIGAAVKQAQYVSGTGTNALLFRYTVVAGDMDMDGITPGITLILNSGTIKDPAGNNALLPLQNTGVTTGVFVNTSIPGVVITAAAGSPVSQPFTATIIFSEAVSAFVQGDITATNASLSAFQTTDNITYTVLVTPLADGASTIQVPASVAVNVGGNNNTASNILSRVYDGTAPVITAVDVPANGIYHLGDGLRFKAHFSESIAVTGTPSLDIVIGGTTHQATYVGGSGTDTLGFVYVVQSGDLDMDGITLAAALTGTVKDAAGNNAVLTLSAVNTSGVLVNTIIPGVAISTSATSPVSQPFTATITFTEAVTGFVVGDITATNATLSAFQTTDNITYTVLVTPAADGAVTIQVPASVAVNVGNNGNTISNTLSLVYDGTAPAVTSVDVPTNAIYHLGQTLSFTVHFSEAVNVTGTPTLDIVIGATTRQATYVSGSGTNALVFSYTVQNGDIDMDGVALGTLAGTIKDAAGNNGVLTLNNVGITTGVLVNTAIPAVTITTTATSPVIAPFTATITFTEAMTGFVAGDMTTTNATLSAFQTTDNITYTVLVTPVTNGAVTVQVPASVAVNIGNNANTASNTLSLVYDGTAPVVTSVDVPANAIYQQGQALTFTVHFSETVNVTGTPVLDVVIGATTRQANYLSGSGTNALVLSYTVQNGDMDMDGIALGTLAGNIQDAAGNNGVLTLNNVGNTTAVLVNTAIPGVAVTTTATSPVIAPFTATITFTEAVTGFIAGDITATNATLSAFQTTDNITYTVLVTPTATGNVTVQVPANVAVNIGNNLNTASNTLSLAYDGTAPVITQVDVPANGIYHLGDGLRFKVYFSESVTVTGTPSLDIVIGGTNRQATYVGGSGADTLSFLYFVQNGDVDMDGITLGAALSGTIHDVAGNNAVLTLSAVNTSGILVNTAIPGAAITTTATSPVIAPFTASITFTEAVSGFAVGDITVANATLSGFQTTDNITYTILVTPTATGAVTLQVPASVAVNVGNNANTASNTLSVVYDGTAPVVTAVDVPANGIYNQGQVLSFTVHFDDIVHITGTPTLAVVIGAVTRQSFYATGDGSKALVFSYTVQNGDMDMDGIALGTLVGTIKDGSGNNAVLTLNNVGSTTAVLINTAIPDVAITTTATSPVIAPFTASITFTEAVTGFVVGDITVTNATLSGLQTTDNITYTVLVTPTATGTVTVQVPASVAVNIGNNPNTVSNTLSLTYDGTTPVVTSVDVPANGVYNQGQVLSFTVHFSEIVNVTGTPALGVVIGATTRQATYVSGSGTNALVFSYTVQNGDMDMDGIAVGTLVGTIKDAAGNNGVLTLNNVGNTTAVLVNTTAPGVAISTTATSPVIALFTATITFTEAVTGFVPGDIAATNATLSAFQTTDNITYTVLITPTATGAVTVQVPASVAVNTGNNANTASNTLSLVYDGTPPVVTSVDVPANGVYNQGQVLSFTVHFSEIVNVTGTPALGVVIGATTRQAAYVSGSGTNALVFSYTVQNGDMDMDGIAVGTLAGTIKDAAGNNGVLTLNNVGNTTAVLVNTAAPGVVISTTATSPVIAPFTASIAFTEAVTGFVAGDIAATNATLSAFQTTDNITYTVLITPAANGAVTLQVPANAAMNTGNNGNTASNTLSLVYDGTTPVVTSVDVPANGVYNQGQVLSFTVHFSEIVNVTGTPALGVVIGATTRQAAYVSGSGTNALVFSYTVQNGDMDIDGIALGTLAGTIKDAAGNNGVLTLNNVGNTTAVLVNTTAPGVTITTTATSPVIAPFTASITFTEAVTGFTVGDITVTNATLSGFQTTDNITYTVLITPTANGAVTLQVPANAAVNTGNNGNTASNTLSLVYDGTSPVVTSVDVPANGVYNQGQVLSFTVHFSEIMNVTGTPTLGVVIGATTRQAAYVSGSGTNALVFSYTVQNGDMDMDGIALGTLAGTIKDAAGNNGVLTLNNVGNTTGVLVNTTNPGVTISTTATSPVIAPFTATIIFTEAVTGFAIGDITVTNATLSGFQTTDNITYTVLITPTANGAVTLQVPANAAVNTGNNGNTTSNTLSLVYAGTAPVINSVDVPANGTYHLGQTLSFTVHFSEAVNVTGVSSLNILIGATNRQATLISGSGTNALLYRYTVQAGDMDIDGITLGTALTGTIRNAAGKDADLTLNNVGNTTRVLVNTTNPDVVISTTATSPVIAPFTASITFTEAVTGFAIGDITVTNATLSGFQTTDNITYTVLITPTANGAVTVQVPANAAMNTGNNGNTASNTLSLVYAGTAPVVSSVDVPANGTYHLGQVLSFTVHFSEVVNVTGASNLTVIIGAITRQATLISGSGTNALLYRYTVQAGDMDIDGITLGTVLTGTIRNAAGKDADLTLNNVGNTTGVLVNTTNPGVVISTTATSPVIAPFTASITFTEAVTGFAIGDITVTNATLSGFQTTDNITYTVLITPTANGAVTLQVPANAAVNTGNNGNTASNTLSLVYAGTAPVISSVDVPANGTYHLGQTLSFTVHFSEAVNVTSASSLNILIGATTRQAALISGSGTNALLYRYTVQAGDMDIDGITLGTALTGTIRNAAGKDADLTLHNVGNTTGVLVNTRNPAVVLSGSIPARVNTAVTIHIDFSEAVTGFTTTGITASNATVSNLQTTDNIHYTAVITALTDGAVNITVPAGVAVNAGGNDNTASNALQFIYDATPPVIGTQTFNVNFNSPAGTLVGTLTATDAAGTIQNWKITADGSGGAFAIDATGAITVKDAAILSSQAGTTASVTVTVSDGLNTSIPTTILINISTAFVNQAPTLDEIADAGICAGTETHTIQLTGISAVEPGQTYTITVTADQSFFDVLAVNGSGVLSYRLKNNITNGSTLVTVTIKDNGGTANGGVDTRQRTFNINVNALPIVTISSNKGNTVSKGDIIQLTATGGNNYSWTQVDGIISGQQTALLQARIMVNTTYNVTVRSAAGCSNTGSISIAVVEDFKVESTNILTPNGDGKNDKWVIRNLDSYPDNEVKIYDRAGRIVYQRRNYSNDWNGTMNGSPLAEGTYYYILTINGSSKTAKGYITIIRDQQ